ncbi:O-antigen polysaccharide polymerase Wzy [Bacillus paranthracis]
MNGTVPLVKILSYITLYFSNVIFIIWMIFSELNITLTAICGVFIHNILYLGERLSERIILFTFLVARLVVKPLTGYYDKYNDSYYGLDFNNEQII